MRTKFLAISCVLLIAAAVSQSAAQTKCVWIDKSKDGIVLQKIGISFSMVKLFAGSEGKIDVDGVKLTYKTLLQAYEDGSVVRIADSTEDGETIVYGGKFDQEMKESSARHDRLIIETVDRGSEPQISRIRIKSIEAVSVLVAMIGANDLDDAIDNIDSALEQGGVFYVRDYEKDSEVWAFVN
jgi:hypothetical protein